MIRLITSSVCPHLDGAVTAGSEVVCISVFDRSIQQVKGFLSQFLLDIGKNGSGADMRTSSRVLYVNAGSRFSGCFTKRDCGKDIFYHGMLINEDIKNRYVFCEPDSKGRAVYDYLMEHFEWPLLPEWGDELWKALDRERYASEVRVTSVYGTHSMMRDNPLYEGKTCIRIERTLNQHTLIKMVSSLIKSGRIRMACDPGQKDFEVKDLDAYLESFGSSIGDNFDAQIKPLREHDGNINNVSFLKSRLYPLQASLVNGAVASITGKKRSGASRYVFFACEQGIGKTKVAIAAAEKYENEKFLRQHPEYSFKDICSDPDLVKYRGVVTCPGHMVEKWAREIRDELPYVKVRIVRELSQIEAVYAEGMKPTCKEIIVLSNETAKNSYSQRPVPTRVKMNAQVRRKHCKSCGSVMNEPGDMCPKCHHRGFKLSRDPAYVANALICPSCGMPLIPYHSMTSTMKERSAALLPDDFANPRTDNVKCFYCDESLWEPNIKNLELPWFIDGQVRPKKTGWIRCSTYANAKRDAKKSIWLLSGYHDRQIKEAISASDDAGVRRYSVAAFIAKKMKGFFSFYIADEAHKYKATSAQGEAFAALVRASKRTLVLTGTLTGGKACDLFYLLYRLDPKRMVSAGFAFTDSLKFSYRYGTVVKEIRDNGDNTVSDKNYMSAGTKASQPRVAPGISPLIFADFLLDRAVFLNMSDMSRHLPDLKEKVISVKPANALEETMLNSYQDVISTLVAEVKKDPDNFGLMGSMLQFSLSYLDKPYSEEVRAIRSPITGSPVADIPQFDMYRDERMLTSKEKELIRTVKAELSEDRPCFIYCEYTASPETNVTDRLKAVLENSLCERVEILRSVSPQPAEREAYIKSLALEGVRVIITNARCVETGLDFIFFDDEGKEYNFPSIIFYQMGYSLFTVSQASRRHYRLIQKRECRTYYMCWSDTAQEAVISIIASKMVSASALQGKWAAGALSQMSTGVDVRLELAKRLSESDHSDNGSIQDMFDVLEDGRKSGSDDSAWEPMKKVEEVIDKETYDRYFSEEDESMDDLFAFLDTL